MSEPQQSHHPYLAPLYWTMGGMANVFAWVASVDIGLIVSFCSVAVPAIVGAAALALDKLAPAAGRFRKAWVEAKDGTLSGKLDGLTEKLDEAHQIVAMQERQIAIQEKIADDAERLANLNKRQMERAEARADDMADQLAKMARRLEDANDKLHEFRTPLQNAELNSKLALEVQDENSRKIDATLEQARQNAGLTGKVDEKAAHIAETVDHIAGKSSGEYPPTLLSPPPSSAPTRPTLPTTAAPRPCS